MRQIPTLLSSLLLASLLPSVAGLAQDSPVFRVHVNGTLSAGAGGGPGGEPGGPGEPGGETPGGNTSLTYASGQAFVGRPFELTPTISGGGNPLGWAGSNLPTWASIMADGRIVGTPLAPEPSKTVAVSTNWHGQEVTSPDFVITTEFPFTVTPPLDPIWRVGGNAGGQVTKSISDGVDWDIMSGPVWMGIDQDGVLGWGNGTPVEGLHAYRVRASLSGGQGFSYADSTVRVLPALSFQTQPENIDGMPGDVATTRAIPDSSARAPYSYTLVGTTIPNWMTVSSDGTVRAEIPAETSGTTYTARVALSDATGGYVTSQPFTVSVSYPDMAFKNFNASLYNLAIGRTVSIAAPTVTGGDGVFSFTLLDSAKQPATSLPAGLTFNPDGTVTGAATSTGTAQYYIRATDGHGKTVDSVLFTIAVTQITAANTMPVSASTGAPLKASELLTALYDRNTTAYAARWDGSNTTQSVMLTFDSAVKANGCTFSFSTPSPVVFEVVKWGASGLIGSEVITLSVNGAKTDTQTCGLKESEPVKQVMIRTQSAASRNGFEFREFRVTYGSDSPTP